MGFFKESFLSFGKIEQHWEYRVFKRKLKKSSVMVAVLAAVCVCVCFFDTLRTSFSRWNQNNMLLGPEHLI